MAAVLTVSSILQCPHQSPVTITPVPGRKLTVSGSGVLVQADASSWTVASCPAGQSKCTTVTGVTSAGQSKLKVAGSTVVTTGFSASTDKGTISAKAAQTKLNAS